MDTYVLLKNNQVIFSGNTFPTPDVNQHVAQVAGGGAPSPAAHGYDAMDYQHRGEGMEAWRQSGSPAYDIKGRELDPAGWPTGKMQDGSAIDGGAPAIPSNLVGGPPVVVSLATPTDTAVVTGSVLTAGRYWLETGEQPDQNWVLSQGAAVAATGNGSSEEVAPFSLVAGEVTLSTSFNKNAVSDDEIAKREASGQGVSTMHYVLHLVA